jgi:hypothetical protein
MTSFANDHASGQHQHEIVEILNKLDACFHGHSRAIGLIALTRMMAVMIGPADKDAREKYIEAIPAALRAILDEMDRIMAASTASSSSAPSP